jgi:phosphatidylglycerophosphatase A
MKKIITLFANGFGTGLSPFASGTTGTLPGILIAFLLAPLWWPWQVAICIAMTLLAIPICDAAEKIYGKKDDGRIVADEYFTFPICLIGIPWTEPGNLWMLAVAFVICRILDIWKPFPARQSQNMGGGLGIVIDDFITTIYALGLNHVAVYVVCRFMLNHG